MGHGRPALATGIDDGDFWRNAEWIGCADGKTRRIKPGIRLLANGIPARVGKLRAFGNAIVPQAAAKFIQAASDSIEGV
jgi:DNA (cytosine-5)-methyltransferase 1